MLFFKKYYVNVTEDIDVISIIHDLKYAIRDSGGPEGLLTVITPSPGAGLVIMTPIEEAIKELKATMEVFGGEAGTALDGLKREKEIGAVIQSAILGRTLHIPFQETGLLIDPYDDVLLIDFEHRQGRREFVVQIISEAPAKKEQPQKRPVGRPLGKIGG